MVGSLRGWCERQSAACLCKSAGHSKQLGEEQRLCHVEAGGGTQHSCHDRDRVPQNPVSAHWPPTNTTEHSLWSRWARNKSSGSHCQTGPHHQEEIKKKNCHYNNWTSRPAATINSRKKNSWHLGLRSRSGKLSEASDIKFKHKWPALTRGERMCVSSVLCLWIGATGKEYFQAEWGLSSSEDEAMPQSVVGGRRQGKGDRAQRPGLSEPMSCERPGIYSNRKESSAS